MVNRRDARLDKHIGKRVTIIFWDGVTKTGVLSWENEYNPNRGLKPFMYYLLLDDGVYFGFRKSSITRIEIR